MLLFPDFVTQKSRGTGMPNGTYSSVMRQENKSRKKTISFSSCPVIFLRVVINVLTNLKRFHRPVSSSLSI